MVASTSDFDFRRPSKLGRDVSRSLELAHETFARRVSTGWGAELRAYVQVEPAGIAQLPYDDVIRSMPSPHLVVTAAVPPLAGSIVLELDLQLGMLLVDRLLGGEDDGRVGTPRRPSDVEVELLGHLASHAVLALAEVTAPMGAVDPRVAAVDVNPQLVQVAAPSDPTLMVSFAVTVSGPVAAHGTLSVIYPGQVQTQLLEHLASSRGGDQTEHRIEPAAAEGLLASLGAAAVDVAVRLHDSPVTARQLHALQVGDVLRLDHRVGRPALGVVDGTAVLEVHLGRRGPRRAAQVEGWHRDDGTTPTSSQLAASVWPSQDMPGTPPSHDDAADTTADDLTTPTPRTPETP